ncbi:DDE_3 domain-containing protein [Trichonephila clavipes]|nr:DDE_3 domain-containing protein [Trichonephila clavipes]
MCTDEEHVPLSIGLENTFPGPDCNEILFSSRTSPDSHWSAIQSICLSGEDNTHDTNNPTFLEDTIKEVMESCFGQ